MAVEDRAKVIADLCAGKVLNASAVAKDADGAWGDALSEVVVQTQTLIDDTVRLAKFATVVDVQAVYADWKQASGRYIYEDHRAAPPWENALLAFENEHGNVYVIHLSSYETSELGRLSGHEFWETDAESHVIEWNRVRWIHHALLYMGGHAGRTTGRGRVIDTVGPLHMWRIAVYPDGEMADVRWLDINPDLDRKMFDTGMMVLLQTLNLCNCTNVAVAEPDRPRAERRRLARHGVTVNEIHIRPIGRSYRGKGVPLSEGAPLASVRGHFNEYGPKYGKGLLFGKYEGRFWIPQHLRGSAEIGEAEHSYVVETE